MAKHSYSEAQAVEFFDAISQDDVDSIKRMLEAEPDLVSATQIFKYTPLHVAAQAGHKEIVEALIEAKADVDAKDSFMQTPLHFAAQKGHKEVANILVAAGADLNANSAWEQTPESAAALHEHHETAAVLQPVNIKPAKEKSYVEQQAAREAEASQDSSFGR